MDRWERWADECFGAACTARGATLLGVRPATLYEGAVVDVRVPYVDGLGTPQRTAAHVYAPAALLDGGRAPLAVAAGYALGEDVALGYLADGFVMASTGVPDDPTSGEANPICRSTNLDLAVLRLWRSLPFVDDTRVVLFGGSAGGYMSLMLASETFPVAAVAAECPPLNLGFETAYGGANRALAGSVAGLPVVVHVTDAAKRLYGDDPTADAWWAASPLGRVDTITAPVSLFFSTADVLVPIEQVSPKLVRPPEDALVADGYVACAEELRVGGHVPTALVDVVPAADLTLTEVPVPATADPWLADDPTVYVPRLPLDLPVPATQWSVCWADEGGPRRGVGHFAAAVSAHHPRAFVQHHLAGGPTAASLTPAKLASILRADDRDDVLRSLRTYAVTLDHEDALLDTYAALPAAAQTLGPAADVRALVRLEQADRP